MDVIYLKREIYEVTPSIESTTEEFSDTSIYSIPSNSEEVPEHVTLKDSDDTFSDQCKYSTPNNSDDEFPDLQFMLTPLKKSVLEEGDLAYVQYGKVWWPSLCKKIYPKKRTVSVVYINCYQTRPILVPMRKVRRFSEMEQKVLWDQEDQMEGLKSAMLMADSYRSCATKLRMSAKQFFSLDLSDQRQRLNELLEQELKAANKSPKTPPATAIVQPMDLDSSSDCCQPKAKRPKLDATISANLLSSREQNKLKSASKARATMYRPLVRFIRTAVCVKHLIDVCHGRFESKRHNQFVADVDSVHNFWSLHLSDNTAGLDFFGDKEETPNYVNFLYEKLAHKSCLKFCDNDRNRRMYIMLVLVPEAIKEALRRKHKLKEEELENALKEGFRETATEKKARQLAFNDPDLDM